MSLATFATILTIINIVCTACLAILIFRFNVKKSYIDFERGIKDSIQQINIMALSQSPILPYLQKYDKENYDLSGGELIDIYYLYFEMNLIRSLISAKESGVADIQFYGEAVDERIWRVMPYRHILEKMEEKGKNYSKKFIQDVLNRMDELNSST